MMRALISVLFVIAAGPLWAQGQIIIPDDGSDALQAAPAGGGGGTELTMKAVTVKGQSQLRGRFGDKWQADEVRQRAAMTCIEGGMQLVYFQPGNTDSKGRTEFAAVCQ